MDEESTETKPVSNKKMQKFSSFTEIKSMFYGMPALNKILSKNVLLYASKFILPGAWKNEHHFW